MKKLLLFVCFTIASNICIAQKFEEKIEDGNTYFEYIAKFDSTFTKDQLYDLFLVNIEKAYAKSIAPPEVNREKDAKIFAQCRSMKLVYDNGIKKDGGYFKYNLYVICKDGKAKITISDLVYKAGDMVQMKDGTNFSDEEPKNWTRSFIWNKQSKKEWNKMKDQFREEINFVLVEMLKINKGHSSDF